MDETLRKLQLLQLEMLCIVDTICKKNKIEYSLYAGTLLGAVRHKGFIPWDDDLDICMTRENYNRFLTVWENEQTEGYFLQNKENTPTFSQSFTKIRKDGTTFIQDEWEKERYHTGVFIDVFPIDRMPNDTFGRIKYKVCWCLYQLYTREFVPSKEGVFVRTIASILLGLTPEEKRRIIRNKVLNVLLKNNKDSTLSVVEMSALETLNLLGPADLFEQYTYLEFEGKSFMCVKKWEEWLTVLYGDYMQLPPEQERKWTHHPIVVDFEKSYEELGEV